MYMYQATIKVLFLVLGIGLGSLQKGFAQSQPVRISIELPAGVGLSSKVPSATSTKGGNSGISESEKVDFALIAEDGTLIPLTWIQMRSLENSQFLIDLRDEKGIQINFPIYFLNDQTDELSLSKAYERLPALMQFDRSSLLIRNKTPRQTSVRAWLGIPSLVPGTTLVLEYF
ncbi:hypothetical protein [uncultured Algoriphagus sp.]|uniref:hypothetical protein n=1 Tax=uncultured Algoriphagus sp. TaxID=417365 RepID=UPI002590DFB7|nr:hypothetical protein [uncultured Algoriphagus sp.]